MQISDNLKKFIQENKDSIEQGKLPELYYGYVLDSDHSGNYFKTEFKNLVKSLDLDRAHVTLHSASSEFVNTLSKILDLPMTIEDSEIAEPDDSFKVKLNTDKTIFEAKEAKSLSWYDIDQLLGKELDYKYIFTYVTRDPNTNITTIIVEINPAILKDIIG